MAVNKNQIMTTSGCRPMIVRSYSKSVLMQENNQKAPNQAPQSLRFHEEELFSPMITIIKRQPPTTNHPMQQA